MSTDKLPFLDSELEEMSQAVRLHQPSARNPSVAYHIDVYRDLITETKEGYSLTIYEFTNDAWSRDTLEQVIQNVRRDLADRLSQFLQPLDEEFLSITQVMKGEDKKLWRDRVPKPGPHRDESEFAKWRTK